MSIVSLVHKGNYYLVMRLQIGLESDSHSLEGISLGLSRYLHRPDEEVMLALKIFV